MCGREASTSNSKSVEVQGSSLARRVVSFNIDKELYSTLSLTGRSPLSQDGSTSIPSRGEYQYSLACFMLRKPG